MTNKRDDRQLTPSQCLLNKLNVDHPWTNVQKKTLSDKSISFEIIFDKCIHGTGRPSRKKFREICAFSISFCDFKRDKDINGFQLKTSKSVYLKQAQLTWDLRIVCNLSIIAINPVTPVYTLRNLVSSE